jgi:hypothetical protein
MKPLRLADVFFLRHQEKQILATSGKDPPLSTKASMEAIIRTALVYPTFSMATHAQTTMGPGWLPVEVGQFFVDREDLLKRQYEEALKVGFR